MAATSTCYNPTCRNKVAGSVERCPNCGRGMRTPAAARRAGWLLVALGVFLIGFMGLITLGMLPSLLAPGQETSGSDTFTGTTRQARMILTLFGAVIAFGIATAINGAVQIATGQRNRKLVVGTLVVAAGLIFYAIVTTSALKG